MLRVIGAVSEPRAFGFVELAALEGQVADVGALVPGRQGAAVRLESLLAAAGGHGGARYLTLRAEDGFSICVPLEGVREALVVYRLGAEPLPAGQGGPHRFLIPGVERCGIEGVDACANVKALAELRLTQERTQTTHRHDPS